MQRRGSIGIVLVFRVPLVNFSGDPDFGKTDERTKGTEHGKEPLLYQAEAPQSLRQTQRHKADRGEYGQNQRTRRQLGQETLVLISSSMGGETSAHSEQIPRRFNFTREGKMPSRQPRAVGATEPVELRWAVVFPTNT